MVSLPNLAIYSTLIFWCSWSFPFFPLPIREGRPRYFSYCVIFCKPKFFFDCLTGCLQRGFAKKKSCLLLTFCPDVISYVYNIFNTFAHLSIVILQNKRLSSTNKRWFRFRPLLHKEKASISSEFAALLMRPCSPSVHNKRGMGIECPLVKSLWRGESFLLVFH